MEHLWSRAVANDGNGRQTPNPRNAGQCLRTVADSCRRLRPVLHGEEGVDPQLPKLWVFDLEGRLRARRVPGVRLAFHAGGASVLFVPTAKGGGQAPSAAAEATPASVRAVDPRTSSLIWAGRSAKMRLKTSRCAAAGV